MQKEVLRGDGGSIVLTAGKQISNLEILTLSSSAQSGEIQIIGLENLNISDIAVITSKQVEIEDPIGTGKIIIPVGGQGQSGRILIIGARDLTLNNSSFLSDTNGSDPAGDIIIISPGWINFNSSSVNGSTQNIGPAANIMVVAGKGIRLTGTNSQLLVQTSSQGSAGHVSVDAPEVTIEQEAKISTSTSGDGIGGNITVTAQQLSLVDRSELIATASNQGRAGNITLNIADIISLQNSDISTISQASSGGEIIINFKNFRLFGDSDIRSFVSSGTEGGGAITFNGDTVIALDDSDILAFADDGRGGNITFNTAFFGEDYVSGSPPPFDGNDRVDVNASGAINGEISIPDVSFIENSLNELSDDLVNPETITIGSCIVRNTDTEGSFTVTGTDGLPLRPDDTAASSFPAVAIEALPTETAKPPTWNPGDPIIEPAGAYTSEDGRVLLGRQCSG